MFLHCVHVLIIGNALKCKSNSYKRDPYYHYSQLPSEPSSPPNYLAKQQGYSNTQQLPSSPRTNGVSTVAPPLIEINNERPKIKKGLTRIDTKSWVQRSDTVLETNQENSDTKTSSASTPSAISKSKNKDETLISPSITVTTPQDILTQKLLDSSGKNAELGDDSDDESGNEISQMTDDELLKSSENLCNGNTENKVHEIV